MLPVGTDVSERPPISSSRKKIILQVYQGLTNIIPKCRTAKSYFLATSEASEEKPWLSEAEDTASRLHTHCMFHCILFIPPQGKEEHTPIKRWAAARRHNRTARYSWWEQSDAVHAQLWGEPYTAHLTAQESASPVPAPCLLWSYAVDNRPVTHFPQNHKFPHSPVFHLWYFRIFSIYQYIKCSVCDGEEKRKIVKTL